MRVNYTPSRRLCRTCGNPIASPRRDYVYCNWQCYISRFVPGFTDRFWSRIDRSDDCWIWRGNIGKQGYGWMPLSGKKYRAHRLAYELTYGLIPDGLVVCHTCDRRDCVRPDHLFLGTRADNVDDCISKGRNNIGDRNGSRTHPERLPRGERAHAAKLTANNVKAIRSLVASGISQNKVAARFGMSRHAINNIVARRSWAHIP